MHSSAGPLATVSPASWPVTQLCLVRLQAIHARTCHHTRILPQDSFPSSIFLSAPQTQICTDGEG